MSTRNVFINCPFSPDYEAMFRAAIFAVARCGFVPRSAREKDDGGEVRIEKICAIISECKYGIHDISKTELDGTTKLPRFNMPLELGLFLGAKKFGSRGQQTKKTLILDRKPDRYDKFISDISGQDVESHNGSVDTLITRISNWLRHETTARHVPGGKEVAKEYRRFKLELKAIAKKRKLAPDEVTFRDIAAIAALWSLKKTNAP